MKLHQWLIPLSCVLVCLVFFRPESSTPPSNIKVPPIDDISEIGQDAIGRRHWEWLRQRDPSTGRIPPNMHRREQEMALTLPRRSSDEKIGGFGKDGQKVEDWSFRGPWNVGGRTRGLAIDVSDPALQTLLAGGVSGGLWRTTDEGSNWARMTGSSSLHNVSCIVQDRRPGHQNTWYYGTGEGIASSPNRGGGSYLGDGVFKSTDSGLTWNVLPSTATGIPQELDNPFNFVWRLVIDTSNTSQDEVYAATAGVIYRSVDGGESWTGVLGSAENPALHSDLAISSEGVLYATMGAEGSHPGIYRSANGVDWTDISPDLMPGFGRIALDIAPSSEELIYFLVSDPLSSVNRQMFRYTYISGNGSGSGGVWDDLSGSLSGPLYEPDPEYGSYFSYWSQRGYNLMITINPANFNSVTIGGVHLWRNTVGWFYEWATERVGGYYYNGRNHHADIHKLVYQPGSSTVAYSASDGGVHKTADMTADSVQWTSLNNGLNTTQFYTVAMDQERPGNNVILGGAQDNGTLWTPSGNQEFPWVEAFGGDGAHCAVLDGDFFGDYLVSYYRANMFRIKLDPAGTVVEEGSIKPVTGGDYLFINPFITDPADETVVYLATSNGVMRNTDVTAIPLGSWEPTDLNWGQLTHEPVGDYISALATNGQDGHALYFGTSTGKVYRVDDALNAPDGSIPLPLHGNADFPEESYVSGIVVHPEDDQRILVSLGNYMIKSLWYSEDGGASWTDVEGNLAGDDGPSIRCAEVMPGSGPDLWLIGTTIGLYSTNIEVGQPVVWTREAPESIGNVIVDDLAVRVSDRKVVVGTHGRGIHSVIVPQPSAVPGNPAKAYLAQNYPNPFNPSTQINFEMTEGGQAQLEVFDLAGRRVRVLLNENREAGRYSLRWDGTDERGQVVGAGTYLYRLQAGSFMEQRKMILLK